MTVIENTYKWGMGAFDLDNGLPQKCVYVGGLAFAYLAGISENIKQNVLVCLVLVNPAGYTK